MTRGYILDGEKNAVEVDIRTAAAWLDTRKNDARRVGRDEVGEWEVSTVFIPFDMQFGEGPPLIFETMVFPHGTRDEDLCWRYSTWAAAEAGHRRVVEQLRAGIEPGDIEQEGNP